MSSPIVREPVKFFVQPGSSNTPGFSQTFSTVQTILKKTQDHFRESVTGNQLLRALASLFYEYSEENWDGYGASALSEASYFEAMKLINLLPHSLPVPEIVPEPTGDIAFEWYRGKDHIFVISVSGNHMICYAGIFGRGNETHGTEYFDESLPAAIVAKINRLFYDFSHIEEATSRSSLRNLRPLRFDEQALKAMGLRKELPDMESYPLRGQSIQYDGPTEPIADDDWDVLK